MDDQTRLEFSRGLQRRLGDAVRLKRARVRIDDWRPEPHYCHENVAMWVKHNPHHKHVFGFVFFDFGVLGFVQFAAHSAVEIEDGSLVDITPHGASEDYPFIRHTGTYDEFAGMAEAINVNVPI